MLKDFTVFSLFDKKLKIVGDFVANCLPNSTNMDLVADVSQPLGAKHVDVSISTPSSHNYFTSSDPHRDISIGQFFWHVKTVLHSFWHIF